MRPSGLENDGFDVVADVVRGERCADLIRVFDRLLATGAGNRAGLEHPVVRDLAASPGVRGLVEPVLGGAAFAYRATLFDKTSTANWPVAWHQDLVVPVQARHDATGFGHWSRKQGTWYVQPPAEILGTLLAVRIDVDGSDEQNGALAVLPGTHRDGVLSPEKVAAAAACIAPTTCRVPRGGALRMRPLVLHSSSRALQPSHRRVVHFEFAAAPLPHGLAFFEHVT